MAYDMTGQWGFGGSSGLLDWGSDIARMWGMGMATGMKTSEAMDAYRANQVMNPLRLERELMDDQLKREQMQAAYTPTYKANRMDYITAVQQNPELRDPYAEQHYGNMDPWRQKVLGDQQQNVVNRTQTAVTNGNHQSSSSNHNVSPSQQGSQQISYEYDANRGMYIPVYGKQG